MSIQEELTELREIYNRCQVNAKLQGTIIKQEIIGLLKELPEDCFPEIEVKKQKDRYVLEDSKINAIILLENHLNQNHVIALMKDGIYVFQKNNTHRNKASYIIIPENKKDFMPLKSLSYIDITGDKILGHIAYAIQSLKKEKINK